MDAFNHYNRMDITTMQNNATVLASELQWLSLVIDTRMKLYWGKPCEFNSIYDVPVQDVSGNNSPYGQILSHYQAGFKERVILLLAIAPHIQPHLLDIFFIRNADYDRGFTEFGGIKGQHHSGFIPTGETAAFILAANDLQERFTLFELFGEDHFFKRFNILRLNHSQAEEPLLSGVLHLSTEHLNYFTSGVSHKPDFHINFPAKRITTALEWEDLVLEDIVLEEVIEIKDWITYGDTLLNEWDMKKKIKPGYRALFYGPPGTGKTLTASLIGKAVNLDVYRIDLSMVVSKFIGETEKNLANIFSQAENKNWILFFDEADALFGKRTQTSSSNDRYANQEISYLLQRIEDFPGVVILATNLKANLDEAFSRRFQSMVYFPMPSAEQRRQLWIQSFSSKTVFESKIDFADIAHKYELAGGAIINVTRYCSLKALKRNDNIILYRDLINGIKKEFGKDGKTI